MGSKISKAPVPTVTGWPITICAEGERSLSAWPDTQASSRKAIVVSNVIFWRDYKTQSEKNKLYFFLGILEDQVSLIFCSYIALKENHVEQFSDLYIILIKYLSKQN